MENTRETLLTNIGEARANAIKKNGGDKYTHCQLQQLYRLLGTPKAVALTDFQSYPMGQVYCSKYIDGGNEIECRFRLPKIIGTVKLAPLIFSSYYLIIDTHT